MKKSDEIKRSLQTLLTQSQEFSRSITPENVTADANTKLDKFDADIALLQRQLSIEERAESMTAEKAEKHHEQEQIERGNEKQVSHEALHRRLFIGYIRGEDVSDYSKEEKAVYKELLKRGQTIGDSAKGGITTPEYFSNQIIKALKDSSGAMQLIDVLTTGNGNAINFPKADDINGIAVPIAEATRPAEDEFTFERVTLDAHKFTSKIFTVSNELITDSIIDIEAYMVEAMRMRFDRALNLQFTTGAGTAGVPEGFALDTNGYELIDLASKTAITYDELIDIIASVDNAYMRRGNAKWTFNQNTLAKLRKLKDGNGLPIWSMGDITKGVESTLLGFPYVINNDMPSFGAVGEKPVIAFGDFKTGYRGRLVNGMAIRKSTELYIETDEVGFVGFMRFDGKPMDTRAVKLAYTPA